jgi:hypothetical protein
MIRLAVLFILTGVTSFALGWFITALPLAILAMIANGAFWGLIWPYVWPRPLPRRLDE